MASLAEKHQLYLQAIARQLYTSIPVCTSVIDTIIIPYLDMDDDTITMKQLLSAIHEARKYLQFHDDEPSLHYTRFAHYALNSISEIVRRRSVEYGLVFREHYTDEDRTLLDLIE
jgi:hypothetical protein